MEQFAQLKQLFDSGEINEEEYSNRRTILVDQLTNTNTTNNIENNNNLTTSSNINPDNITVPSSKHGSLRKPNKPPPVATNLIIPKPPAKLTTPTPQITAQITSQITPQQQTNKQTNKQTTINNNKQHMKINKLLEITQNNKQTHENMKKKSLKK